MIERFQGRTLVAWDNQAALWRGILPAGVPTYLQVRSGSYRIKLNFEGEPQAATSPAELPLELLLDLETDEVGAYRQYGQQVDGELQLTNSGTAPVTVSLEAATSDYRWRLIFQEKARTVAAGDKRVVPLMVHVPSDAWADWPVRISARATNEEGAQAEAFIDISAGRETRPVNAVYGWSLPEELRGGFNVAWNALGGRYVGNQESAFGLTFDQLIDGMAVENQGVQIRAGFKSETADLTVQLAADEPVEVAGLAFNLLSSTLGERFPKSAHCSRR